MEVKRYTQFINEAKKDDAKADILRMFETKPTVETSSKKWPTEKSAYSQSGVVNYLKTKHSSDHVIAALHDLKNDKKSGIKYITVKNYYYDETYPYYYVGLTEDQVREIKSKYEESNEVDSKEYKKTAPKFVPKPETEEEPVAKKTRAPRKAKVKVETSKASGPAPKKVATKKPAKTVAPKKVAAKKPAKTVAPKKVAKKK